MAIIGSLLKKGITFRQSLEQKYSSPFDLQKAELKKLMLQARSTQFGEYYQFESLLWAFKHPNPMAFYDAFKKTVPVFDYDSLFDNWWDKTRQGDSNVCWPGRVKYFALSSGTSGDTTKYIPVTKDMIKAIRRTGVRQILALANFDVPEKIFSKGILMLGGSTNLRKAETFYDGDLSGITAGKIPFWFQHFYKPGKQISKIQSWGEKLDEITRRAKDWDIGYVVGVPAWIQLMMEKIIDHYKLKNIHEIWPNLSVYVHGGVAFDPYKKEFEKLLGQPLTYIETYLASEGFVAFQARPDTSAMRMIINNGIFFEFVPFNDTNFDAEGNISPQAETLMIDQVNEGEQYALLLSTCAGAWRYLIGDVVKVVNKEFSEIVITGRTKHFLSLCGEHLSVDNMNQGVKMVEHELNIGIREFTVSGIPSGSLFAHKWYIGCDTSADPDTVKQTLDDALKKVNDDYAVERNYALRDIFVELLPTEAFYEFMRMKGKEGAQNKFPRVLKNEKLHEWEKFVKTYTENKKR